MEKKKFFRKSFFVKYQFHILREISGNISKKITIMSFS